MQAKIIWQKIALVLYLLSCKLDMIAFVIYIKNKA